MMAPDAALAALLHLLAFAYWLGGDIGVFYSSFLLADPKRPREGRLAAGRILADVDLAPRICLILALPTGLLLAAARGWLALAAPAIGAAVLIALLWIWLILRLHHRPNPQLRALDGALRLAFAGALAVTGAAGLVGLAAMPAFIAAKCLILGFCVVLGLLVRRALTPFGPAFQRLAAGTASAADDQTIGRALARARGYVVAIWLALIAAAGLGLATPT